MGPCQSKLGTPLRCTSPSPSFAEKCEEKHSTSGNTIVGHYEVLTTVLGQGCTGCVHLCIDIDKQDRSAGNIAAKILDKMTSTCAQQRRFKNEIRVLSTLRHPNIIRFDHAYETAEHIFLMMEKVSGSCALSLLNSSPRRCLPEDRARHYARQLIDAVSYMHSVGVAHCDIKLENILVSERDDSFVLCDFGFAHRAGAGEDNYVCGMARGTLEYAAPELLCTSAKSRDYMKADIWAFGIVLHALTTGRLPYCGLDDEELSHAILHTAYRAPCVATPQLADLLQQALCHDPLQRPTAEELVKHPWFIS